MSLKEAVSGEFTSAVTTKTTKFKNDKLLIKPVSAKKKLETEKQKTKPTFSIRELIFIDVPYYCCADVMENLIYPHYSPELNQNSLRHSRLEKMKVLCLIFFWNYMSNEIK